MANMYGNQSGNVAIQDKPINPTVTATHGAAISELQECIGMADALLSKVRGAQPSSAERTPEEMPSVMASASKINTLASALSNRMRELHEIIGG